ncbi:hypothetical protein B0H15DRAFT_1020725 [Mycena belliarum]|uniref:Uncharacterized protein n=1 Tax=Mycena belliarum TaxID=1033014 RepID=A0AAD6U8A3_9AGAR|nr:hypothetical protein B0H15DRAFT_1020725 [Mycena belliae]
MSDPLAQFEALLTLMGSMDERPRVTPPLTRLAAPLHFAPNARGPTHRPQAQRIHMLARNPDGLDDLCPRNSLDNTTRFVRSNVRKAVAEQHWEAENFAGARAAYIVAASEMVGKKLPLSGHLRSDVYAGLGYGWDASDLLGCFNGIVECSRQLKEYDTAILWIEEADTLDKNLQHAQNAQRSKFEWSAPEITSPDYYFERLTALCLSSAVFLAVGNTGAAVHRRWLADEIFAEVPAHLKTPDIQSLYPFLGIDILALRHPDPNIAPALAVKQPSLQICGSWKKLSIGKSPGLVPRLRCAVTALNGQLYLLGGEKSTNGPYFFDFWTLDLARRDGWRKLPDFPIPEDITNDLVGYQLAPHRDGRLFVFTGLPAIAVFDPGRSKWSVLPTTFVPDAQTPEWPYTGGKILEAAVHCIGIRMYVFGGVHQPSIVGTDLLMELYFPTLTWRRLSGRAVPVPHADAEGPGPRGQCHSWVARDATRIYYMFGGADRQAAMLHKQAHGAFYSHGYGDLWSWDIRAEAWTQERVRGNAPSPRSEMACTYSPALDKVIVFGGYSPTVPTWFDDIKDTYTYTYYADTFVGDMRAPGTPIAWKQVLSPGFPTYRAEAALVTDPATGKIYLFGGYKNTTYVRSKKAEPSESARAFVDLWQLRLDVPGGCFEGVDLAEEARSTRAGPWQRCFTCGITGPGKRCGGACNGHVFFCDADCLKEGWKEHKEMHGCRKA